MLTPNPKSILSARGSRWSYQFAAIAVSFALFATATTAFSAAAHKVFVHSAAKFSFEYPAAAKVDKSGGSGIVNGTIKDSITVNWKSGQLGVRVFNLPLEKAISQTEALGKDEKGQWYRPGRFDTRGKATNVKFGKLTGLYASAMCGVSDDKGFHGAGGDCLSGFLTDGKRTAYFETDGLFPLTTVVKVIMPSFKFTH